MKPTRKSQISIRRVETQDAQSIVDLLNPIIQADRYTTMDEQVSLDDQLAFIREFPTRGVFYVAVCNDSQKIVGLQDVVPKLPGTRVFDHVGLISTFVSLSSHRKGIGQRLSRATFQEAKKQGFLKICATVRADNTQAVPFYLSLGFRIIGTAQRHAFIKGRYIDEILMERFLDQE